MPSRLLRKSLFVTNIISDRIPTSLQALFFMEQASTAPRRWTAGYASWPARRNQRSGFEKQSVRVPERHANLPNVYESSRHIPESDALLSRLMTLDRPVAPRLGCNPFPMDSSTCSPLSLPNGAREGPGSACD